jgi:hypothetical protein
LAGPRHGPLQRARKSLAELIVSAPFYQAPGTHRITWHSAMN